MKRNNLRLERLSGCVLCRKQCQFNTLTYAADDRKAVRYKDKAMIIPPEKDRYACNSSRAAV